MPHANPNPSPDIDLQQINARNDPARHIVAGCAAALPTLADLWRPVDDALNDAVLLSALVARLSVQVTRLSAELDRTRLDRANLRAAMRAALAAHAAGEADPMWYLRDELDAPESPSAASGGRGDQLPPDAPASPPRAAQRPPAHDGHQHRRHVPRDPRRRAGTAGVAVPLRARPLGVAAGMVAAAWWLHHTRPHWWPALTVLTGVAAWAVALFGARWRFPTVIERVYAAITIYAGGIWLSAATAIGPLYKPLLQALVIGTLILSVPWWAHRRRRAKVALERKLHAWPDIAKAIGLAGTEVMSATVDV